MLTCELDECGRQFRRPGTRGPRPRFCSIKCRGKWSYRRPRIREYQRRYAQRPDRREVRRLVARARYATPEYRAWAAERYRRLYGDPFPDVVVPSPYTGHFWFDMARAVVGGDPEPAFRDYGYDDEVGEAVLALLEGRDMGEAVTAFRRAEYVPRHLTIRTGDWVDAGEEDKWFDGLARVESAEDEAIARDTVLERAAGYHHGDNRRRFNNNKGRQQPHRRRMKDGKGWMKHQARARGRAEELAA